MGGGAYKSFPGSAAQAKHLADDAVVALAGRRYEDFRLDQSHDAWTPWFLAVGAYLDATNRTRPLAEAWNGARWVIQPIPSTAGAGESALSQQPSPAEQGAENSGQPALVLVGGPAAFDGQDAMDLG